jgi:hypothetical protein
MADSRNLPPSDERASGLQSQSNPAVDAIRFPLPNNPDPHSETLRRPVGGRGGWRPGFNFEFGLLATLTVQTADLGEPIIGSSFRSFRFVQDFQLDI